MPELPSGTVTFLFTDIEGGGGGAHVVGRFWPRSGQGVPTKWVLGPGPGTRLWEQHPEVMRLALTRHDALLRTAIEAHGGLTFKTVGQLLHLDLPVDFPPLEKTRRRRRPRAGTPCRHRSKPR